MLEGLNILVAEDNLINQKIANYILTKQRANVLSAANGYEAIDLLAKNRFDIILMDIQMPGLSGIEAARYIRNELKNNIPIIALTADIFADNYDENVKAGFNEFIVKPFDPLSLCKLILQLTQKSTH